MAGDARRTIAVEAEAVSKRYGDLVAVDRVDLAVAAGTIHGLVGPNGAGKTTLLAMLFGLVEPDGGRLRMLGRDRAHVERGWLDGVAGFIEAPRFYPYLSGRRNLEHLARLDGGGAPARIDAALDDAGLASAADARVRGYSLGMRQRLGLASALLRDPHVVILDEPANGLDPAGARDLRGVLRRLAERGAAVLISSHDMVALEHLCDAVTVLAAGRAVFDGTMAELAAAAPSAAHRLATSDDDVAVTVAASVPGVTVGDGDGAGSGITIHAGPEGLDRLTIELGRRGVGVRTLQLETSPLTALYFRLTEGGARPAHRAEQAGRRLPLVGVLR